MKKILSIIFVIICCFALFGCGVDVKQEAERLDAEYYQPGYNSLMNLCKEVNSMRSQSADESFNQAVVKTITDKYKPEFIALQTKFNQEKDIKETAKLREQINYMIQDSIDVMDIGLEFANLSSNDNEKAKALFNKLSIKFNNLFSEQAEYKNQYSLITTGKSSYELTLRNYQEIQKGDTYAKVVQIFKMPGRLTNSEESNIRLIGHRKLDHYIWESDDCYVRIMFENGKAYMMEQKGLK